MPGSGVRRERGVRPEAASAVCAGNTAAQLIVVVISQQHAWMCSTATLVNDTLYYPGDLPHTPENDLLLAVAQVNQGSNLNKTWRI